MCTLLVAWNAVPGMPLVVGANRDERLDRPAAPPHLWPGRVPFLAPKDLQAGGTWLGLNGRSLFVGVTNRFGVPKDDARKSRGELVTTALEAWSARDLHAHLATLPADRYNAFHLLYADDAAAFVTWSDGAKVTQEVLAPGVHVVTERSLGASDEGRTELVLAEWKKLAMPPRAEDLEAILRIHDDANPLHATCVHLPGLGYGTRSSMVVVGGKMFWAEGPPCETPYVEIPIAFK